MPHVAVKLWPGKTKAQKEELAEAIGKNVRDILKSSDATVSVSIEEVDPKDWMAKVYDVDITAQPENVYKNPATLRSKS